MKVYVVLDEQSRLVAAAMNEAMAMDALFTVALQNGRIDEERGTFDFSSNSVISTELDTLRESMFFTDAEINELQDNGIVIV
jgi:hypothetical protein